MKNKDDPHFSPNIRPQADVERKQETIHIHEA